MWGYHLRVNAAKCNDGIKSKMCIEMFTKDLVSKIEMKEFGEPQIVRFGDDPRLSGFTLIQLIETSNIAAHFCDYTGEAYIDIFSCKEFDIDTAMAVIDEHFEPVAVQIDYTTRQAPQVNL